jgi:hypothetical protein
MAVVPATWEVEAGGSESRQKQETIAGKKLNQKRLAGGWWLTPGILATLEAEIRGLQFKANLANSLRGPISNYLSQEKGLVEWLKAKVLPKFKPQYHKKTLTYKLLITRSFHIIFSDPGCSSNRNRGRQSHKEAAPCGQA